MRLATRLFIATISGIALFITLSGCAKKEEPNFTLDQMLTDVQVDLTKIKKEVKVPAADEIAVQELVKNGVRLADKIDSLLTKFPDSFFLYSFKVYQNKKAENGGMFKFAEGEYLKDSTNLLRKYFYTVLNPDTAKSIQLLEKMIADNPDNYLGYLGLAQRLMEANPDDLAKPAKLTYLALLKEHRRNEPYYLLSDIYSRLKRDDDNAVLNGILLINDPANEKAFFNILSYFGKKGQKDKAVQLLTTFRQNNPDKLRNLDMAYYLIEFKFYQEAVPFLAKVDLQGEDKLYALFLAVRIESGLLNKAEALRKFKTLAAACSAQESFLVTDPEISDFLGSDNSYLALVKKVEGSAPTIGDKAPLIKGKILNGVDFRPETLTGKVYLIDFWATWCSPCREELPNVRSVYDELRPEGFEVVGINLDAEREEVISFTQASQMKWLQIYSGAIWKDENAQKYQVKAIPATYLVDKKGIIRYKGIRGRDQLLEKVKKLLSENSAI